MKHKSAIAGEVLDIFLRITSEKMLIVYGPHFMKLLVCFEQQLLPLLAPAVTGTQRLAAFLSDAIKSNGSSLPSIYEES
jgi:hypothetical protein